MENKGIWWIVGIVVVLLAAIIVLPSGGDEIETTPEVKETIVQNPAPTSPSEPAVINYQTYNHQFAEGRVLGELDRLIGGSGTVAFYLPPTNYIEVEGGTGYGVAFALNNPNPSGENYFEYEFTPDASIVENCGVSLYEAKKWMTMGHKSFGTVPQGWVDKMTVYFEFPDIEPCTAKFNFLVTKDSAEYGTQVLEFHIL